MKIAADGENGWSTRIPTAVLYVSGHGVQELVRSSAEARQIIKKTMTAKTAPEAQLPRKFPTPYRSRMGARIRRALIRGAFFLPDSAGARHKRVMSYNAKAVPAYAIVKTSTVAMWRDQCCQWVEGPKNPPAKPIAVDAMQSMIPHRKATNQARRAMLRAFLFAGCCKILVE